MKQVLVLVSLFLIASCRAPQPAAQPKSEPTGLFEGIATGKTHVVDLTHALNPQNPYWPGPGYAPFKYEIFAILLPACFKNIAKMMLVLLVYFAHR